MHQSGFITELGLVPPSLPPPSSDLDDSGLMHYLAHDFTLRLRTEASSKAPMIAAREAHCNALTQAIRLKSSTLAQLEATLATLLAESDSPQPTVLEVEFDQLAATMYFPRSEKCEFEGLQYEHLVNRLQMNNAARRHDITRAQEQLAYARQLHTSMLQEFASIEKLKEASERELVLLQQHQLLVQSSYQESKERQVQRLEAHHALLTDEVTIVKLEKVSEIAAKDSINRLKRWLKRQREARKIMRLYIGLEELGTKRLDKVLATIVTGLMCDNLDSALLKYSDVMAKNSSLVRETEYKLQQQTSLEVRLMRLQGEKEEVERQAREDGEWAWQKRKEKVDIYHTHEVTLVKSSQAELSNFTKRQATRILHTQRMLSQLSNLVTFLHEIDPFHASSVPTSPTILSPRDIVQACLVLEKKVTFLREVTQQRIAFRQCKQAKLPFEPLKQLFSKGKSLHTFEPQTRLRAKSLTRTMAAAELSGNKGLLSRIITMTDPDNDFSPKSRLITIDLPHIAATNDQIPSPKSPLNQVWSDSKLKKDWESLRKHSQRLHRTDRSPRVVDFMISLRESEQQLARLTAEKWRASGIRTPPLKIPALSSPRSKMSTRADTRVSVKSRRDAGKMRKVGVLE